MIWWFGEREFWADVRRAFIRVQATLRTRDAGPLDGPTVPGTNAVDKTLSEDHGPRTSPR